MADIAEDTQDQLVDSLRVKASEIANSAVRANTLQAVESFSRFNGGTPLEVSDLSEELIGEWVVWMLARGYAPSSAAGYVSRLSALVGKVAAEAADKAAAAFSAVKAKFRDAADANPLPPITRGMFRSLRRLVNLNPSGRPDLRLGRDMALLALCLGGLTLDQLAAYRKTDYQGDDPAVRDIIDRYSRPRNSYLFPLRQSERTPGQLREAVGVLIAPALRLAGIEIASPTGDLFARLWAAAALDCGIAAADIAGCLSPALPADPIFAFVDPTPLADDDRIHLRRRVSRLLTADPAEWYAMQFRSRVSYQAVTERLSASGITLSNPYYPTEEIYRRTRKRLVAHTRPVVAGLLFFQARAAQLDDIFGAIGDLAWGYRQTRSPRSPYARIPADEIDRYRRTIGAFTPDMEILPAGATPLLPGDRVIILGGDFIGLPATVDRQLSRTIYRLKLLGANAIEWVVDLPHPLLSPA